jgi:hypothetical protein
MTSLKKKKPSRRSGAAAARADRHKLYEESVQNSEADVDFVEAEFRR